MTPIKEGWTELGPGRNYPVLPFFIAIFASWLLWIPAGARAAGVLPFPFPFEIAWLGVFTPLLFGAYFTMRAGGSVALGSFFARFVRWRFPVVYWVYALFAIPFSAVVAAGVFALTGSPDIFANGLERLTSGEARTTLMDVKYGVLNYESIGPFNNLFAAMASSQSIFIWGFLSLALIDGGVSEEPGWRGYAYPILRDRWGALPAALFVGLIWALWHMGPPQWQILFADGKDAFFAFLPGYAAAYLMLIMPIAVVYAWLYEASRGSLLICFFFHAVYNITAATAYVVFPEHSILYGVVAFIWLSAIIIISRCGWRRFVKDRAGA